MIEQKYKMIGVKNPFDRASLVLSEAASSGREGIKFISKTEGRTRNAVYGIDLTRIEIQDKSGYYNMSVLSETEENLQRAKQTLQRLIGISLEEVK